MNRYNKLKLRVLSLFATTQGEWLAPDEAAAQLAFVPARAAWTLFQEIIQLRSAGMAFTGSWNVAIPDHRTWTRAASLVAFAKGMIQRLGVF